jgi:hypothetical protein
MRRLLVVLVVLAFGIPALAAQEIENVPGCRINTLSATSGGCFVGGPTAGALVWVVDADPSATGDGLCTDAAEAGETGLVALCRYTGRSWIATDIATQSTGGGATGGACADGTICAEVTDADANGDIAPELQTAINSLLWPGGTLTTAAEVVLAAPPGGAYSLSSRIVICGDTSPPSGSTAPDCTGTQTLPVIRFTGAWAAARLVCNKTLANQVQNVDFCFQIGDAWAEGSFTNKVKVAFESALYLDLNVTSDFVNSQGGLWCNGCSGDLKLIVEGNIPTLNLPGPAAVIAGGELTSDVSVSQSALSIVVMYDGEQKNSVATVRGQYASVEVGSANTALGRWGPIDGCTYNGYSGDCDNLRFTPATSVVSAGAYAAMDVAGGRSLMIEGTYYGDTTKPAIEFRPELLSTPQLFSAVFRGACRIGASNSNACISIRAGDYPDASPFLATFDGTFLSDKTVSELDKGGVGCNTSIRTPEGPINLARIVVGPNASGHGPSGGFRHVTNAFNYGQPGNQDCFIESALQREYRYAIPAATLGATPPYCLDFVSGAWGSCSAETTKMRAPAGWREWFVGTATLELSTAAASTTSLPIRLLKNGTDPLGKEPTSGPYYSHGATWNPAVATRASDLRQTIRVNDVLASSDYLQLVADATYATVGGQYECRTLSAEGVVSAATASSVTDSLKSWTTNEHVGRQLCLVGGPGHIQCAAVASNTATQATRSGSFSPSPSATLPGATHYRIYGGSTTCAGASEALPAMRFSFNAWPSN